MVSALACMMEGSALERPEACHDSTEDDLFARVLTGFRSWPLFRGVRTCGEDKDELLSTCKDDEAGSPVSVMQGASAMERPTTPHDGTEEDDIFARVLAGFRSWPHSRAILACAEETTYESGDAECDGASPVGSPRGGTMCHIDTDYSPTYVYQDRQCSFFPALPAAIDPPTVMNNIMVAPIPCALQFVSSAFPYVAPAPVPPCATTMGPSMQHKSSSPNTPIPSGATIASSVHMPDEPVVSERGDAKVVDDCRKASVLLRNLPDGFTRDMLMDVLCDQGLARHVDFLYVPADFNTKTTYGYAFVHLCTPEAAELCFDRLSGFSNWKIPGENACEATWCTNQESLHTYIERYRNSRIMHEAVEDEYKPALFSNGVRVCFPLPTKSLRAPRLRKEEDARARH